MADCAGVRATFADTAPAEDSLSVGWSSNRADSHSFNVIDGAHLALGPEGVCVCVCVLFVYVSQLPYNRPGHGAATGRAETTCHDV